jgi:hypothetical protein
MNWISIAFFFIDGLMLLIAPRRWAILPLIAGACYMTLGQGIDVGPLSFTVIRMLIAVGFCRVLIRRERIAWGIRGGDWLMIAWAAWAGASSIFHEPFSAALVFRLGLIYNACGIYFLSRILCTSIEDGVRTSRSIALLLIPVALTMVYEQVATYNLFSILGGVSEIPEVREGRLRASGPFAHSILAGTVGATCIPLMIGIWPYRRVAATLGVLACVAMVVSSASSGPVLSSVFGIAALCAWRWRASVRLLRWLAIIAYLALEVVMKAPAYYLLSRIDLVGGSTGWYRARLIESSVEHIQEWWLAGTDYTRHWMATGLAINSNQADITNHYISMGVLGGLPLMLLLILVFRRGFAGVGTVLRDGSVLSKREQFVAWTFGASLLAHAATCVSVSYFDQSVVFLYVNLAVLGSISAASVSSQVPEVNAAVLHESRVRPRSHQNGPYGFRRFRREHAVVARRIRKPDAISG